MRAPRTSRSLVVAAALLSAASCSGPSEQADPGGRSSTTSDALVAIATEYVGEPDDSTGTDDLGAGVDGVAVHLMTGDREVSVIVADHLPRDEPEYTQGDCSGVDPAAYGCAVLGDGVLVWQTTEPEEDPGYVSLTVTRKDSVVSVLQSGEPFGRDPRRADLDLSVDEMSELAHDPRIGSA